MKKKIISALLTASLMLGLSYQSAIASEIQISEIYVALDGDDLNPGTIDAPLKTPEAARDKIRTLKANGELGTKGAVVYFREGIYPFSETFMLGKEDSGTEGAPITYRAYMEENVSFIGGFDLKPEDFEKVTDPKITGRLVEESARDKLYMLDLKKYGIREVPIPRLIGTYSYWRADGVATEGDSVIMKQLVEELGYMEDSAATPELFIDDEIMTVAKYPNGEGEYVRTGVIIEPGPFMRNWNDDIIGSANWIPPEERVPTPFSFKTNEVINRLPYWKNANQALMWGRW